MGFRFRKIIKVAPGVHINLSKSGASASVGGKGATVNVGTSGKKTVTLGVPGTGLSYQMPLNASALLIVALIAVIVGITFLIAPDITRNALHWWQPKWF